MGAGEIFGDLLVAFSNCWRTILFFRASGVGKGLAITRRVGTRAVVEDHTMNDGNDPIFFNKVAFIALPVMRKVFLVRAIRMVVAMNLYRGKDDNCEGVLPISFRSDNVQGSQVEVRTIPIGRRVLEDSLRLECNSIRNRGKDVRSVGLVCFLKYRCPCDPNYDFFLSCHARFVALFLYRFLKVVRRFVLGSEEGGSDYNVSNSYRAAAANLVTANFCRIFVWVKWRRV